MLVPEEQLRQRWRETLHRILTRRGLENEC